MNPRNAVSGRGKPSIAGGLLAALLALAVVTAARAGPPFVTDDPEPVDYGAWEVNYALTGTHSASGTRAFLPQVDANYGPIAGVQLHFQPQLAYASDGDSHAYGIGDTELGIKIRFWPRTEDAGSWMVSFYPLFEVPTGSAARNLGAGSSSTYLPIWFQKQIGGWTTYGGGGLWINSVQGGRNALAGGWVALYQFTPSLQFGGEVFVHAADTTGGRGSSGFNLGGIYALAKDYNLLFSAGRGLSNVAATNQASAYLGLQVAY